MYYVLCNYVCISDILLLSVLVTMLLLFTFINLYLLALKVFVFMSHRLQAEVCRRGYPRTRIRRFSCGRGRSADPPNKHICGPSADLRPRVLFARPTSNESANVPFPSNLRTDPYLDTAVGYRYVRKPVWLYGALGIVYWIQCNCNPTLLADADGPRIWVAITVADADHPRTWCLRTRIIRGREICGSAHLWLQVSLHVDICLREEEQCF